MLAKPQKYVQSLAEESTRILYVNHHHLTLNPVNDEDDIELIREKTKAITGNIRSGRKR